MIEGFVWPHNIAICAECGDTFCVSCAPACGRCGHCKGVLCWSCYHTAKSQNRGWCALCVTPRRSDDDLQSKAPSDARYYALVNASGKKPWKAK